MPASRAVAGQGAGCVRREGCAPFLTPFRAGIRRAELDGRERRRRPDQASGACESRSEPQATPRGREPTFILEFPGFPVKDFRVSLLPTTSLFVEEIIVKLPYRPAQSGAEPSFVHPRHLCVLRPQEVRLRVTLSVAQMHRLQREHRFPPYQHYSGGFYGLCEHVLDAWIAARIAARADMGPLGSRPALPVWTYRVEEVPAQCGIRLMCRRDVLAVIERSSTQLYRLMERGVLPRPVPLGPRASRWVAHELERALLDWRPPALRAPPGAGAGRAAQAAPICAACGRGLRSP